MRIAYLDCLAGISGDMMLGALTDAAVPADLLHETVAALGVNATLQLDTVTRSGIGALKISVLEDGILAETAHTHEAPAPEDEHSHDHPHEHAHDHAHEHSHEAAHTHPPAQPHSHAHVHGRSLSVIRKLIQDAPISAGVKTLSIRTFELLGEAEARIHNVPIEQIHFHEVGAVDTIVDIVACCAGLDFLEQAGPIEWHCSPINVGSGTVECAHGTMPVPAPATADLLRGMPTYAAHVQKELVTPTGAALLKLIQPKFGPQPEMRVERIGYGAGSRNPKGFANVLRICLGEGPATAADESNEVVTVLETALDDLNPQVLAMVTEQALKLGALDAMLSPVIMKKGRSGTLLTILCRTGDAPDIETFLFRETSTLGVRSREERRTILERRQEEINTTFGVIRVKIGLRHGIPMNIAPEFEDCRTAATTHGVPVKMVIQAAITAWTQEHGL